MNSKKGQGLSVSTIILVAIGLLVLIVLAILIFRSGSSADSSTACVKQGGMCKTGTCTAEYKISGTGLCGIGQMCCSPVKKFDLP